MEFEVRYKSPSVGVEVTFELREFYVFVKLSRLQGGGFPKSPGEITPETDLNSFELDDVVNLRGPASLIRKHSLTTKCDRDLFVSIIDRQAENLRTFAADLLAGDFAIFTELDQVVKARAREAAFEKWGDDASDFGWKK